MAHEPNISGFNEAFVYWRLRFLLKSTFGLGLGLKAPTLVCGPYIVFLVMY